MLSLAIAALLVAQAAPAEEPTAPEAQPAAAPAAAVAPAQEPAAPAAEPAAPAAVAPVVAPKLEPAIEAEPARAAPASDEDYVEGPLGRIVLLPVREGREVRTAEGFLRVEGAADERERRGAFGVLAAGPELAAAVAGEAVPAPPAAAPVPGELAPVREESCRAEREAYLKELLRMSGIEGVDHPLALLEALGGGAAVVGEGPLPWPFGGPVLLPWRFGASIAASPALSPLAWDSTLRMRARDLARCAEAARSR